MEILYIKGDATAPIGSGVKVITHICNDIGGWGKGRSEEHTSELQSH